MGRQTIGNRRTPVESPLFVQPPIGSISGLKTMRAPLVFSENEIKLKYRGFVGLYLPMGCRGRMS